MKTCIQSYSSGNQQQEKRDITKLQLSEEQRQLIEDNFSEIRKTLSFVLAKKRRNGGSTKVNHATVLAEALSYLPDVTLEYDQKLANKTSFAQFATQRCIMRLTDEYRKMNRHIVNDVKYVVNPIEFYPENKFEIADNNLQDVEWQDLREGLVKKADKYFKEYLEEGFEKLDRSSRIHKILLFDYILPKSEGKAYKTLEEIGNQVGMQEARLSQIIKGDRMRNFIKLVYKK
jgi:hypothetical protein